MPNITRGTIKIWVVDALRSLGGTAHYKEVAKELWKLHGHQLSPSHDRFYTWQYDMRWAAQELRDAGNLQNSRTADLPKGVWELTEIRNAN